MKQTLHFYSDSGHHGWLKVKRCDCIEFGIIAKISGYSYERGEYVYLEEDCDASIYIQELKSRSIGLVTKCHYTSNRSRIRNYKSFTVRPYELLSLKIIVGY